MSFDQFFLALIAGAMTLFLVVMFWLSWEDAARRKRDGITRSAGTEGRHG